MRRSIRYYGVFLRLLAVTVAYRCNVILQCILDATDIDQSVAPPELPLLNGELYSYTGIPVWGSPINIIYAVVVCSVFTCLLSELVYDIRKSFKAERFCRFHR